MNNKHKVALDIAVIALFAALLSGGKLALAVVPNVEIVTLLIAVFATTWGARYAIPAVIVFVLIETILWGFNTWVLSYLIHWNALALVYILAKPLINRLNIPLKIVLSTAIAVVMTALFGVLTSLIDTFLAIKPSGMVIATNDFWYRFAVLYGRGVVFFVIHIVSNAVMLAVGYVPLTTLLYKLRKRMYPPKVEAVPTQPNETTVTTEADTTDNISK